MSASAQELRAVRGRLVVRVHGGLLLGGHTPPEGDLDQTTARAADGCPIIPASALKGALREAAIQLLQSGGEEDVVLSWEPRRGIGEATLRLDRLFGAPGGSQWPSDDGGLSAVADGGWMPLGLRIGDARPETPVTLGVRHGVSIDRWTRSRARGRLYRRSVAEAAGATFVAPVHGRLSEEDLALLGAAASLVQGAGNSQSRGLGRMEVRWEEDAEGAPSQPSVEVALGGQPGELAVVELTAIEPLHLGGIQDRGNLRTTLRYVPGSALRGALVAAARRSGLPAEAASALWGPGFHISDLWPTGAGPALPMHPPRTLVAGKYDDRRDRCDRVLREAAARWLAERGLGVPVPPSGTDGAPLAPVEGLLNGAAVSTRLVTRLARDPWTRSAAHGQLHVREQVEVPARFAGTATGVSRQARTTLDALARSGEPVYVGALRSRGLGLVRVRFSAPPADDLRGRVEAFRRDAECLLDPLQGLLDGWNPRALVQVVARTPIWLPAASDVGSTLGSALFPGCLVHVRLAAQRYVMRGGWDDQQGRLLPTRSVLAPGSTWLLQVQGALDWDHLRAAEYGGVGEGREWGLGRVHLCPDLPR